MQNRFSARRSSRSRPGRCRKAHRILQNRSAAAPHRCGTGITYLGGEPFEPENQPGLLELSRRIRAAYPEKSIWSFTGYLFDRDILAKKLGPWEVTRELLSYLDVLVDGPFIAELKNLNLRFRGSSNQRLIDVPASLKTGAVVLWDERQ